VASLAYLEYLFLRRRDPHNQGRSAYTQDCAAAKRQYREQASKRWRGPDLVMALMYACMEGIVCSSTL
jgi:hypothetical protein